LDMLKHDLMYSYRTDEERKEFSDYLTVLYTQMLALEEKDAKPQVNIFCSWCDFRDYCDGYTKACKKTDYKFGEVVNLDSDTLMKEWSSVKNTKKILETRERELAMVMMEKVKNGENVNTEDEEVYIRQNSRKTYDLRTVAEIVPHDEFSSLVNLNKRAVDKYVEKNPAVKSKIMDSITVNFTSPFLATKKLKK